MSTDEISSFGQCAIINAKSSRKRSNEECTYKLGIVSRRQSRCYSSNECLFFLRGEDNFLSQIQCAMFKDETRTIFIDKREYKGALWQQIEGAFRFVLSNIHLGACLDGIYRNYIYELP